MTKLFILPFFLVAPSFLQAQVQDLCSEGSCPCFYGDPCSIEMPARDVICWPGLFLGSEANGMPICSDSADPKVAAAQEVKKARILDNQIEQYADQLSKLKSKIQSCKKIRSSSKKAKCYASL